MTLSELVNDIASRISEAVEEYKKQPTLEKRKRLLILRAEADKLRNTLE